MAEAEQVVNDRPGAVRGQAYPSHSLSKAMDLVEQLQKANLARTTVSPDVFYKVWGYKGESGTTRPLMASLNHYGLMEYVGRGDNKQVRLSGLTHRIIFDKVPNSKDRAAALEAILRCVKPGYCTVVLTTVPCAWIRPTSSASTLALLPVV